MVSTRTFKISLFFTGVDLDYSLSSQAMSKTFHNVRIQQFFTVIMLDYFIVYCRVKKPSQQDRIQKKRKSMGLSSLSSKGRFTPGDNRR